MPGSGERPPAGPAPGGNAVIKEARAGMTLDSADAVELAEMLSFIGHWLASDPGRLGASLNAFVGSPAYGIQQLRDDIDRFVFLLGGSDGQELFSGDDNGPGEEGP